ncbi:hypothetical protein CALCODRAFT_437907, partial [Calocera cornea HHB12733]
MSAISDFKDLKIDRLKDDGSNWTTYKDIMLNAFDRRMLGRHVRGSVKPPQSFVIRDDTYYKVIPTTTTTTSMEQDEADKLEEAWEKYRAKEASIREIVYMTISPTTLIQVKDAPTAHELWVQLSAMHEN